MIKQTALITIPREAAAILWRARRLVRALVLAIACLVLPQLISVSLVETDCAEARVVSEGVVRAEQTPHTLRGAAPTAYLPRDCRGSTTAARTSSAPLFDGHRLPNGQRAPLTC